MTGSNLSKSWAQASAIHSPAPRPLLDSCLFTSAQSVSAKSTTQENTNQTRSQPSPSYRALPQLPPAAAAAPALFSVSTLLLRSLMPPGAVSCIASKHSLLFSSPHAPVRRHKYTQRVGGGGGDERGESILGTEADGMGSGLFPDSAPIYRANLFHIWMPRNTSLSRILCCSTHNRRMNEWTNG